MKNSKIVIAGGSGFIGNVITNYFGADNEIVILSRNKQSNVNNAFKKFEVKKEAGKNVTFVYWDGAQTGEWCKEIDGCNLVINLAGRSVNCRYNARNKKEIFDSRVNATKAIGEAIRNAIVPPQLWINAASATIYKHATEKPYDEYTGVYENDFSVQVCKLWEKTFLNKEAPLQEK